MTSTRFEPTIVTSGGRSLTSRATTTTESLENLNASEREMPSFPRSVVANSTPNFLVSVCSHELLQMEVFSFKNGEKKWFVHPPLAAIICEIGFGGSLQPRLQILAKIGGLSRLFLRKFPKPKTNAKTKNQETGSTRTKLIPSGHQLSFWFHVRHDGINSDLVTFWFQMCGLVPFGRNGCTIWPPIESGARPLWRARAGKWKVGGAEPETNGNGWESEMKRHE